MRKNLPLLLALLLLAAACYMLLTSSPVDAPTNTSAITTHRASVGCHMLAYIPGSSFEQGLWVHNDEIYGFSQYEEDPISSCPPLGQRFCYWEQDEVIEYVKPGSLWVPAERVACPN